MSFILKNLHERAIDVFNDVEKVLGEVEDVIWGEKQDENDILTAEDLDEDAYEEYGYDDSDNYHPLDGIAEEIKRNAFQNNIGPQNFKEHVEAFVAAINWREPFILSIIAFHLVSLVLAVVVCKRRSTNGRFAMFLVLGALIYSCEFINNYGAIHWEELGISQDYFDRNGVFLAVMVCSPPIVIVMGMMINIIAEAKDLMMQLRVMKIKSKMKKNKRKKE